MTDYPRKYPPTACDTDVVAPILAPVLVPLVVAAIGPIVGTPGPAGQNGSAGRSVQVFQQAGEPMSAQAGDVWIVP